MKAGDRVFYRTREGTHVGHVLNVTRSGLIALQHGDQIIHRKPEHVERRPASNNNTNEEEEMTIPHYLSRAEVATHLGLAGVKSLSRVVLPPPDVLVGIHKGWKESTIDTWNASRPGPGWWGPRPVRKQEGDS